MNRVSCVSRAGWFGRKVQRLEIVVVGLDLRAFANRVAHRLEDRDDLIHHAQHGMLDTDGTLNARKGDVEAVGCQPERNGITDINLIGD